MKQSRILHHKLYMSADGSAAVVPFAFTNASIIRREHAKFSTECACTKALHAEYAHRHQSNERVVVIDGGNFRWEGLGNSGTMDGLAALGIRHRTCSLPENFQRP